MPSLREVQRAFAAAALFGDKGALAELRVVANGLDPAARMAIYRNNVLANYRKALGATYPVVRRLVGPLFFNAAVDAFVRAYPSVRGDVNRYGGEMARFLATYAPARELRYLPDIARLEWAIDQANIAAEAPELDLAALAAVSPALHGELRFKLHPSARLVTSRYPILRIWQVNQPDHTGDDAVDLGKGSDTLLVLRGKDGVRIERLAPGEHALLAALEGRVRLSEASARAGAADPAFDLTLVLQAHVASHTIVAFHAPPRRAGVEQ